MRTESGPAGDDIPRDLAHRKGGNTVDTTESSAAHAASNHICACIGMCSKEPSTSIDND
jgi:hypothetical protein